MYVIFKSSTTSQSYIIDISNKDANYLSQIYNKDGTLKKPVQGIATGVSEFYPVDMNRDGVDEIQAYQKVSGLYHADGLGHIINSLKSDRHYFSIWQQWVAVFETEQS